MAKGHSICFYFSGHYYLTLNTCTRSCYPPTSSYHRCVSGIFSHQFPLVRADYCLPHHCALNVRGLWAYTSPPSLSLALWAVGWPLSPVPCWFVLPVASHRSSVLAQAGYCLVPQIPGSGLVSLSTDNWMHWCVEHPAFRSGWGIKLGKTMKNMVFVMSWCWALMYFSAVLFCFVFS